MHEELKTTSFYLSFHLKESIPNMHNRNDDLQMFDRDDSRIWKLFLVRQLKSAVELKLTCISKRFFPLHENETSLSLTILVLGFFIFLLKILRNKS